MSNWQLPADSKIETWGIVNSQGDLVTASASTNTKGAWREMTASSGFDYQMIRVNLHNVKVPGERHLVDIGIGAAGSEQVVAENLFWDRYDDISEVALNMPLVIPAGTRVAARTQSDVASSTIRVYGHGFAGPWPAAVGFPLISALGAETADTTGILVDPGATANTKGAWAELVASTSRDIFSLGILLGQNSDAALTAGLWLIDIGIGGSGVEEVILPDLHATSDPNNDVLTEVSLGPFPVQIPSGSRISARAICSLENSVTSTLIKAALFTPTLNSDAELSASCNAGLKTKITIKAAVRLLKALIHFHWLSLFFRLCCSRTFAKICVSIKGGACTGFCLSASK